MKSETIRRFWLITQKSNGKRFATLNVAVVELCLQHPELVYVAEVTMTEMIANKMYKKELSALDMRAIEWSVADFY